MSGDQRSIVHPPPLQAGKDASKRLVKAAGGGDEAERFTGKSQPRLSAYGLPNTPDFMPINVVAALEAVTHGTPGYPPVTRWLAGEAGYMLVAKPEALPVDVDWCGALGDAVAEFSDVQEGLLRAIPGGVTAEELRAADVRRQIAEAIEKLARLDALAARALGEA